MRKPIAVLSVAALVAAAAIGLSSCGGGGSSSGGKEGGTLKATWASFPDYLDPALSYTTEGWTAMYDTYIPLLTYAHANGVEGSRVVPGLAKALPKLSNGEKTYTLFLRKGLEYSNGEPVKASDFKFAVERMIEVNSGGSPLYTDIVGAEQFQKTKQGPIAGIKTNDKTGEIVIDLNEPQGTFSNKLGLLFVAPLPQNTPVEDLSAHPPPATGPYMITSSKPGQSWEYARNPVWAKVNGPQMTDIPAGHMNKMQMTIIRNPSTQVNDIEQGKYDWMENPPPAGRFAQVKSKYEGTQFVLRPQISTYYLWMNTKRPPFNDLKVRQAVNYAVDTEALERIYAGQIVGTHQILPPGMPGYKKFNLYPHNLATAKQMIKEANPSDRDITFWVDSESPNNEAGEYFAELLNEIGFHTELKIVNADNYFTVIGNLTTPNLDVGWSDWYEDYPHPGDFFTGLLSGEAILPTNNGNLAQLDVPAFNAKIKRLESQKFDSKTESEYAELDKEVMEQAPWAPYGTRTLSTFVSSAIDLEGIIYNPSFAEDLTSFQFK